MGKERDKLIRRYGGEPISEEKPTNTMLMHRYMADYIRKGRLPPEIDSLRNSKGQR